MESKPNSPTCTTASPGFFSFPSDLYCSGSCFGCCSSCCPGSASHCYCSRPRCPCCSSRCSDCCCSSPTSDLQFRVRTSRANFRFPSLSACSFGCLGRAHRPDRSSRPGYCPTTCRSINSTINCYCSDHPEDHSYGCGGPIYCSKICDTHCSGDPVCGSGCSLTACCSSCISASSSSFDCSTATHYCCSNCGCPYCPNCSSCTNCFFVRQGSSTSSLIRPNQK